jgi:hypothetical protein
LQVLPRAHLFAGGRQHFAELLVRAVQTEELMAKDKVHKVMGEYKRGKLHSGSKKGPKVKSRKQAVAIALSEARRSK